MTDPGNVSAPRVVAETAYPKTILFRRGETVETVRLYADGTADGNPRFVAAALAELGLNDPVSLGDIAAIALWLLLRAVQEDAGRLGDRR